MFCELWPAILSPPETIFQFQPTSSTMAFRKIPKETIQMAVTVEDLRQFQSRELEQLNLGTNGRQPLATRTVEWSLVEIVILLTELRNAVEAAAVKR
jgi:hypothetical protein